MNIEQAQKMIWKEVYIINIPRENFDNHTNIFNTLFNKWRITIKKIKIIYVEYIIREDKQDIRFYLYLPTDMIWYYDRYQKNEEERIYRTHYEHH